MGIARGAAVRPGIPLDEEQGDVVRGRERRLPEEHGVDHSKRDDERADPKSQCEHDGQREQSGPVERSRQRCEGHSVTRVGAPDLTPRPPDVLHVEAALSRCRPSPHWRSGSW